MKDLKMESIPFRSYFDRQGALITPQGTIFEKAPVPSTEQITLGGTWFPSLSKEGAISFHASAPEKTTPLSGLCMKQNNQWDHKGPGRQKWLTIIKKIIPTISKAKIWKNLLNQFMGNLPEKLETSTEKVLNKLFLNTPLPLAGISKFFKYFNSPLQWEQSKTSDFSKFIGYIKDFASMSKLFMHNTPLATTTPIAVTITSTSTAAAVTTSSTTTSTTSTRRPKISLAALDVERLQHFINLDPAVTNISGPIQTIPISKSDEDGTIRARTNFNIYNEEDKIRIYQIKPIIYKRKVTTATYLIKTFKKNLAIAQQPTPYECRTEKQQEENTKLIKICTGYTTPGLAKLSPDDSIACGDSLVKEEKSEEFKHCPSIFAPSRPLAYRVQCNNKTAVITSLDPIEIRIYCNGNSRSPLALKHFPVYLDTECEIKLIGGQAESILLPQLQSNFIQPYSLDVDILELPAFIPVDTTIQPELSQAQNPILTPTSPDWLIPTLSILGIAVLLMFTLILCLLKSTKGCKTVLKKCQPSCCSSGKLGPSKNCCCCCCRSSKPPSPVDEVELKEQFVVRQPPRNPSEKENENKMQTTSMADVVASTFNLNMAAQPQPNAPPLDIMAFTNQNMQNKDPFQREISSSSANLEETVRFLENRLARQPAGLSHSFQ
jgi:hypothetical protein